ncbi:MAG: glycoside hydrolase [Bacteroidales bacterium]|nr:glycoside hydrolase [Bacteroidales bacterium]
MSIKKQSLKSKSVTKVSFKISKEQAVNASEVALVGDFNRWNPSSDVMKPLKDGSFSHAIELENGAEYQFRYVADQTNWFNDDEADKQLASSIGGAFNSVVVL